MNARRAVVSLLLSAGLVGASTSATAAARPGSTASPPWGISIDGNGRLTCPTNVFVSSLAGTNPGASIQFDFGLPTNAPTARWQEEDDLPVYCTTWEEGGIRYTQKVLVTSLGTNDLSDAGHPLEDAVILVQISGLNTASDYTTARAALEVRVDGKPLRVVLRDGFLLAGEDDRSPLVGLEIPAEGVASPKGMRLKFQGHMPPAISGALLVKIPVGGMMGMDRASRIQDVNFDEELYRLKRAWRRQPSPPRPRLPIRWADAPKDG